MGSKTPKPQQAPFQSQQQQTNTYAPQSIGETPEAQRFLSQPLDFGDAVDVDPGVAQRTDLAEQEFENESESAFNTGVPRFIRQGNRAQGLRDIRSRGANEAASARFLNQQGNNAMRERRSLAEVGRLERVLPQIYQTGGSGSTSGFNTQFPQSQPGFWQRAALGAIQSAGSTIGALKGF